MRMRTGRVASKSWPPTDPRTAVEADLGFGYATRVGEKFDIPLVAAIAAVPLLLWLGVPAVYWWDEARVAINALEMMQSPGLISTFHNQPDIWNTKPPLAVWLSALSMSLFGVNEFALRLPSALAAIGTTVAVFAFTRRIADRRTAYLASLMLLLEEPKAGGGVTRVVMTGDGHATDILAGLTHHGRLADGDIHF